MITQQTRTVPGPVSSVSETPGVVSPSSAAAEARTQAAPGTSLLVLEGESLPPTRRLVVLVPDLYIDEFDLTRRVWLLASPRMLKVVYVGAVQADADESLVRQQLATLAALTRDNHTAVETRVYDDRDWLRVVRHIWQPGDQILCAAEQAIRTRGGEHRFLGEALVAALGAPVYMLNGLQSHTRPQPPRRVPRLIGWGVSVALIVGFFLLQVSTAQLVEEWARVALLSFSVLAEIGFLGLWNQFLS